MNVQFIPSQKSALVGFFALLLSIVPTPASALSLGNISVQSFLDQPLKAEIEIPRISEAEEKSLVFGMAAQASFKAAGLEFESALSSLEMVFKRRTNGQAFIELRTSEVLSKPFVDLVLEVNWASGRIIRDYTILLTSSKIPQAATQEQKNTPSQRGIKNPPTPSPIGSLIVKKGDTLGKLALATKASGVSLDQMLLAYLNRNPDAFIEKNVNLVKAGKVLNIPSSQEAGLISPTEASRIIRIQSQDFSTYKQGLARRLPTVVTQEATREKTGEVTIKIEEKSTLESKKDTLTLTKSGSDITKAEESLAQARNEKEAEDRAAELTKNISELKKLGIDTAKEEVLTPLAPTTTGEEKIQATLSPQIQANQSKLTESVKVVDKTGILGKDIIQTMRTNPWSLIGGAALLLLLGGWSIYRISQRKKSAVASGNQPENNEEPSIGNLTTATELTAEDLDLPGDIRFEDAARKIESTNSATWEHNEKLKKDALESSEHTLLQNDFSSISLDLDDSTDTALDTKYALAIAFIDIGDKAGARTLLEEVSSEAKGNLRAKALEALQSL